MAHEMHMYYEKGHIPKVKTSKACRSCSLADICLPELLERKSTATEYIHQQIESA
jgi:CRISPR-associated exonuclease Cas4